MNHWLIRNAELINECIGFLSIIQYSSYEFAQA